MSKSSLCEPHSFGLWLQSLLPEVWHPKSWVTDGLEGCRSGTSAAKSDSSSDSLSEALFNVSGISFRADGHGPQGWCKRRRLAMPKRGVHQSHEVCLREACFLSVMWPASESEDCRGLAMPEPIVCQQSKFCLREASILSKVPLPQCLACSRFVSSHIYVM